MMIITGVHVRHLRSHEADNKSDNYVQIDMAARTGNHVRHYLTVHARVVCTL